MAESDAWEWTPMADLPDRIMPSKRKGSDQALAEFCHRAG